MIDYAFFADESGNDPSQSHFVQAGYLATVPQWASLTCQWNACLNSWSVKAFHMSEAESLVGPFARWTMAQRDERIETLAHIISRHITSGLACDLRWDHWKAEQERIGRTWIKGIAKTIQRPFFGSFPWFLTLLAQECDTLRIDRTQVRIVFARDGRRPARLASAMKKVCTAFGFREPEFHPAEDLPPLQSADMLAWRVFRELSTRSRREHYDQTVARHKPLTDRLKIGRLKMEHFRLPCVHITARLLEPGEVPQGKPVWRLGASDVHSFRWVDESDGDSDTSNEEPEVKA